MKDQSTIKITDEAIVRYLTGEATPEEAMILHDWLAAPNVKYTLKNLSPRGKMLTLPNDLLLSTVNKPGKRFSIP